MKKLSLILIFISFASIDSHASMCTTHSIDTENEYKFSNKISYNFPCEISNTILMAPSEVLCLNLKEKISNHDHD